MKPILIIPPAPARWPALEALLHELSSEARRDLQRRLVDGVPGAQDAYALLAIGGRVVSCAGIHKCGPVGLLGPCFTHPDHRRRGYARLVVTTALTWFDMTGGKWLFLRGGPDIGEHVYTGFGFAPLPRAAAAPGGPPMLWRLGHAVSGNPYDGLRGEITVRPLTRADWPAMVALLQFRPGADPRVPVEQSAAGAESFTLELLDHQERGACGLLGACQGGRLTAFVSVATDRPGERTFALRVPHDATWPALAEVALALARSRGYAHVDYPMDGLAAPVAEVRAVPEKPAAALPAAPVHLPADGPPPAAL